MLTVNSSYSDVGDSVIEFHVGDNSSTPTQRDVATTIWSDNFCWAAIFLVTEDVLLEPSES